MRKLSLPNFWHYRFS